MADFIDRDDALEDEIPSSLDVPEMPQATPVADRKRNIVNWALMGCCVLLALCNLGLFSAEGKWVSLVLAICWGCMGVFHAISSWRK